MKPKKFSMRLSVKYFPNGGTRKSAIIVKYGLPWQLVLTRENGHLEISLFCKKKKSDEEDPWYVDVTAEVRLVSANLHIKKEGTITATFNDDEGFCWDEVISWKKAIEYSTGARNPMVHCDVTIIRMRGIAPKRHRSFEKPDEHLTDVILKVDEETFHVSKVVLASQSRYFKAMFFGSFDDAKKEEVELKEVEADVFQVMLEILYGPFEIPADIVRDLLVLADKFDVPLVRQRCEEYLLETDEVDEPEKLCLADTFKLEDLMNDCLESMQTSEDIKNLLPAHLTDLSRSTLAAILEKNLLQC